jgi:methylated-DNA-[protein]-cysteine S-methyltransferase
MQATQDKYHSFLDSPIGVIEISADDQHVVSIFFRDDDPDPDNVFENEISIRCKEQLAAYFLGERNEFDLPLTFAGTEFQNKVWKQLDAIPFGKTISYLQLAKNLGDPKCIRAAGTANGKNPFAIVVPCHRVVGSNHDLVGYAGGLWRKRWLLQHESKQQTLFNFSAEDK